MYLFFILKTKKLRRSQVRSAIYIFDIPRHLHLTGARCLSLVAHCAKAAETSNVNIVRRRGNSSSKHWPLGLESRPLHVSDV